MSSRGRLLVLWNQIEEDVYEQWRQEGPRALEWDPNRLVPDVGTVDEEMAALIQALRDARFEVELVNIQDDFERVLSAIRLFQPDAVFNLVEYFHDDQLQEANIAGLYELLGVAYTGNRPVTLSLCQDKFRTKLVLEANDLPTSPYFLAGSAALDEDHGLEYPVIVKPAFEDASGGIEAKSVCSNHEQLVEQVTRVVKEYEMPALVEEYIEGREIHAAVLGNHCPELLPLFEMEFDDSEFNPEDEWRPQIISFRAKWDPHSKDFYSMDAVVPPDDLDSETEDLVRETALAAYKAVGARDYARIDMRVDEDGQPYVLEVNPNPDLVDGAAYMMCAAASGRSYAEALGAIADLAVARSRAVDPPGRPEKLPSDELLREFVQQKANQPQGLVGTENGETKAQSTAPNGENLADHAPQE